MAQYTNVGGVARRVTKRYENVDGVARNVQKAYNNVGGVARQYFQLGGIKWRKWSCDRTASSSYTRTDEGVGETTTFSNITASNHWFQSWGSWSWSNSGGFEGDYSDYKKASPDEIVGRYNAVDTELREYISCDDNGDGTYNLTWEVIGTAYEDVSYDYDKGTTDYGVVYAEEGELPANGTLEEGSATGSYCVIKVGGTYYYYEKITE